MKETSKSQTETRNSVVSLFSNVHNFEKIEDKSLTQEQLISKYRYLVAQVAEKYTKRYNNPDGIKLSAYEPDDIFQDGEEALCMAIQSYDPTKGPFISYVKWNIERKIKDGLNIDKHLVHIPEKDQTLINKIKLETSRFMQREYREPSVSELAEMLNISEKSITKVMQGLNYSCVSLDNCVGCEDDGDFISFSELVPDTDTPSTDHLVCTEDCYENAIRELDKHSPQEREIFTRCSECNNFTEVANAMGLNRKLVSRTYKKIKTHLRTHLLQSL